MYKIEDKIFMGNGDSSMAQCYHLTVLLQHAISGMSGLQQGARDQAQEFFIETVARDVCVGLLGKNHPRSRSVTAMFLEDGRDNRYRLGLAKCLQRYAEMARGHSDVQAFILEFADKLSDFPLNKLNRWMGYIQGVLIERQVTTVEIERNWTRPVFRPLDF